MDLLLDFKVHAPMMEPNPIGGHDRRWKIKAQVVGGFVDMGS